MSRHVLPKLDELGLDARDIAEAAARRSGMRVEDWLAATLAGPDGKQGPSHRPERRRAGDNLDGIIARLVESRRKAPGQAEPSGAALGPDEATRTAIALESMASWIEHAEERLNETARMSANQQDRIASALSQALTALKERLDTVERQVISERAVPARIEFPVQDAMKALAPLSETLTGLRTDMSRLAERLERPADAAMPPALEAIRADIEQLRATLGDLATRDEITALDRAVRDVSQHLEQGRPTKDVVTLANSVAAIFRRVESLSGEVADGVHGRIEAGIEQIRTRIDEASRAGVDRFAIEFLAGQIVDLRQELSGRAEPQQIERLSGEVASLGRQIADLRDNQVGRSDFAALKSSLEDVCAALGRTVAAQEASTVPEQLETLSRRLDALASRAEPEPANLDPIAEQLSFLTERMASMTDSRLEQTEALAAKMEHLSSQLASVADGASHDVLLKRFDRIEEELRQVGQQADTSTIELMLRAISERFEQPVPSHAALDALEQRIAALADRIVEPSSEPLRQVFDEATSQLRKMQDETASIVERATRTALQDIHRDTPASGDVDALKQGFVELKALQSRSDKKTQETLRAIRDALETLVSRYPGPVLQAGRSGQVQPAAGQGAGDMPSADRLEAAVRRLHAAALSQIAETSDPSHAPDVLSPVAMAGSDAPPVPAAASAPRESDLGNVRANFIAAARRASQTSLPEKLGSAPPLPVEPPAPVTDASEAAAEKPASSAPSLIERLRRSLDARRRPLLFGLAFLVIAAGAAQILANRPDAQEASAVPAQAVAEAPPPPASIVTVAASPAEASLLQGSSLASLPAPVKIRVDPGTVGDLPAQVPAALREAALAGDATAIYEIASRASEGRELAHDPILAAHLYESAARAGYAPAQERLAMLYEKGVGLLRDTRLALTWYERAAVVGNVRAMHNLATLLASGIDGKPDYPGALRWYTEAAEAGLQDSQFNLGVLFARGIGTRTDFSKAFQWFSLAAAQGDAEAAKKRDDVAARLTAPELAAAKTTVERWQPRPVDTTANGTAPAARGRTAALETKADPRS
ncbi:SEL1-like repeat protein [Microvirga subterranea]|uniref:Localization factor PodJL n=1 Tax=Microvirga subterranea TaxID=186651 RepID=A0A370HIF2_9HYPH|nr:SEL1-like repeat protein [Microvirga subterranea]RDI57725.1 localization factor PodJL [Microvirga subterranea]